MEEIDINGSYDLEKRWIVIQGAEGDGIVEFRKRGGGRGGAVSDQSAIVGERRTSASQRL